MPAAPKSFTPAFDPVGTLTDQGTGSSVALAGGRLGNGSGSFALDFPASRDEASYNSGQN